MCSCVQATLWSVVSSISMSVGSRQQLPHLSPQARMGRQQDAGSDPIPFGSHNKCIHGVQLSPIPPPSPWNPTDGRPSWEASRLPGEFLLPFDAPRVQEARDDGGSEASACARFGSAPSFDRGGSRTDAGEGG